MQSLLPDDYKVNLEVFEGPLDLLLYLIKKDELDIYDIPIDRITEQYTEYLNVMKMLDLNMAGEFIVMAATLSLIKSRMLLPVEDRSEEETEDEEKDPRWDLVKQLLAYKQIKEAADNLLVLEQRQQNIFGSSGAILVSEEDLKEEKTLGEIGLFDLIDAFNEVLSRTTLPPIGEIEPIKWSVPDKIDMIIRLTSNDKKVRFSELFNEKSPRGEIIVTFLALLELLRLRQITAVQDASFTEIVITQIGEGHDENNLPPQVIGGNDHVEQ